MGQLEEVLIICHIEHNLNSSDNLLGRNHCELEAQKICKCFEVSGMSNEKALRSPFMALQRKRRLMKSSVHL